MAAPAVGLARRRQEARHLLEAGLRAAVEGAREGQRLRQLRRPPVGRGRVLHKVPRRRHDRVARAAGVREAAGALVVGEARVVLAQRVDVLRRRARALHRGPGRAGRPGRRARRRLVQLRIEPEPPAPPLPRDVVVERAAHLLPREGCRGVDVQELLPEPRAPHGCDARARSRDGAAPRAARRRSRHGAAPQHGGVSLTAFLGLIRHNVHSPCTSRRAARNESRLRSQITAG